MNGIKSFLGILNTAVISVLLGLHMERTIGFENLIPHIQSFFRGETVQQPKEDIEEYGHHSVTENASVHDETLVSHHKSKRDNWLGLLLFAS